MLRLFLAAVLLALAPLAVAQSVQERHSEVRLSLPEAAPNARPAAVLAERLAAQDLYLDHVRAETTPDGPMLRTVLSETEIGQALAAGVGVEVLIDDLAAHIRNRGGDSCQDGRDISRIDADLCGTMGGYLTFDAVLDKLDALAAAYPGIVSVKSSIGQSHEGRDLWMLEISDNPGMDEGEPEVLYTALHHAREPGSMLAVLYFMYYLGEQYGTDPYVTDLVDSRRLFFVPVSNPDGYVWNETTDPSGGGFWRKNKRDNDGNGTFNPNVDGVDPNRNYGYLWGYDDSGSSPNPSSSTYRGPAPFSEPEVAAMRDFVEARRFAMALNYHTYSELLLYSWAYTDNFPTPDDAVYEALGDTLTYVNNYTYGQSSVINYQTNGGIYDWMYGEQETKPKIIAFLPEVGYAFWPFEVDVYRLADENLEMNLLAAEFADRKMFPVGVQPGRALPSGTGLELAGPNPVRGRTSFRFALDEAQTVRVSVFDVLGREVAVLSDGPFAPGRHPVTFETGDLAPGTYVVRLSTSDGVSAQRVTVVR